MPDAAAPGSALAARCTACGTVFRVVPDQLRVSGGWVRCGRCAQVFNASENLIDLDTGVPRRLDLGNSRPGGPADPPRPAPQPAARASVQPVATTPAPAAALPPPPPAPTTPAADPEPPDDPPSRWGPAPAAADAAASRSWEADAPPPAPAQAPAIATTAPARPWDIPLNPPATDGGAPATDRPAVAADATPTVGPTDSTNSTDSAAPDEVLPTPSFLRQAERAARWRQPRVRAALAAGCLAATVLLAGQALHAGRDVVAAEVPALRPLLAQGCAWLGCSLQPPRRLAEITVESSGLLQVPGAPNVYELSVALRNRSTVALAVPAVELSLTDAQGRLLSRRVLQPAEFGLAPQPEGTAFPPGPDLNLQARLQTAPSSTPDETTPAVVGYTIELFYP